MGKGNFIRLDNERRLICDLIDIARRMPLAPLTQEFDVSKIKQLRRQTELRISWPVIMMRAYALVARDIPELRQLYAPLPWPRIYQHHESVCLMTINRKTDSGNRLFFVRFCQPENHSLLQLQEKFETFRRQPIAEIRALKHQRRFSSMPWLVRKLGWALLTKVMPGSRARQMGTFGMSLSGFRRAEGTFHLGPCTTTLGYDQLCPSGKARMTLTFDHRIIDGVPAIEIFEALDKVLKNQVITELQMLVQQKADGAKDTTDSVPGHQLKIFAPKTGSTEKVASEPAAPTLSDSSPIDARPADSKRQAA